MNRGICSKALSFMVAVAAWPALAALPAQATPLHDAVRDGALADARRLIAAGADLEAPDDSALTPLVAAALAGRLDAVTLLIDEGADPNGRDGKGFTALHAAAHAGHLDVVERLLTEGADIDDQKNEPKITPLHAAAERNRLEIASFLLAKGAAVDLSADDGKTPAFMATLKGHMAMVRLLRDRGADCGKFRSKKFREICLSTEP